MEIPCIASIDQGTSSTRVLIVSCDGNIVGQHQTEHTQYYPTAGYVEHDGLQIWNSVKICLSQAFSTVKVNCKIVSIGITNQRETTMVWNKNTGIPYHNAIVWNDNRTGGICERLSSEYGKDYYRSKTGLPIAPYFSATKLMYLLDTLPDLRQDAENGVALFGTIDSWIIWKLTGGKVHSTDVTNASRTLLMNLETLTWDPQILRELNIPVRMLPSIFPSNHHFGVVYTGDNAIKQSDLQVDAELLQWFSSFESVPITGVLGDQQAALFGQTCFQSGDAKCTYGTGAFLLMNTGAKVVHSQKGLLTTVAYKLTGDAQAVYALEGSVAYCGSVMQWLRDNLSMIASAKETEEIAGSVPDNGGVYFVPAFAGLYAPYWRQDARGIIAGLTAFNTKAHIVRAALEAAAFQTTEVVQAMLLDVEPHGLPPIGVMKIDGGMTANSTLMQFQSDLLNIPLLTPVLTETTALGAAMMAGLGIGLWQDLDQLRSLWREGDKWEPHMDLPERFKLLHHWKKALARSMNWVDHVRFNSSDSSGAAQESQDPFVAKLVSATAAAAKRSSEMGHRSLKSPPLSPVPEETSQSSTPNGAIQQSSPHSSENSYDSAEYNRSFDWLTGVSLLSGGILLGFMLAARVIQKK